MKRALVSMLYIALISSCANLSQYYRPTYSSSTFKTPTHEESTAYVHAPADLVYKIAMKTINANPKATILQQDKQARTAKVAQKGRTTTIKISDDTEGYTRLDVIVDKELHSDSSGVFKLCYQLSLTCNGTVPR
jgi:hypothetical protein